ncbi:MAG: hypothetical protein HYR91_14300, partial [Flavobacteriia bacterium]|nr:hypothetical protein [Flavobacteriia bacterium]
MNRSTSKIIIRKFTLIKCIAILIFSLINKDLFSQLCLSNNFHGDIVGIGFGTGTFGYPDTVKKTYPFDCSTCDDSLKFYVIADETISNGSVPTPFLDAIPLKININEKTLIFSNDSRIGTQKNGGTNNSIRILHFQMGKLLNENPNILIEIPPQQLERAINSFYFILECGKNSQSKTTYSLILNSNSSNGDFSISPLSPFVISPIDTSKDVGFAIAANTINFLNGDAEIITFNNDTLGIIAGPDAISQNYYASGTNGHFQYGNGTLHGLDDDIPDQAMDSTDALSNVSSLITNNSAVFFSCTPQESWNHTNFIQGVILSYTSTCPEFIYNTNELSEICLGETLQLAASGGVQYEWLPQKDLSCYNCPNPVFTGDSSQLYTVR